jgi:Cu+-exporting ATPase
MADLARDPVCGMMVEKDKAAATSEHGGKTVYFCAVGCKKRFDANPERYSKK